MGNGRKRYDFETVFDRHGMDALAVDGLGTRDAPLPPKEGYDFIPLWVADMNFPTADSITEAIIERAKHPAFGYFIPRKEYYEAILWWHRQRKHTTDITVRNIGYENGVLGGVISAMRVLAQPGDAVLLNSPVYAGFENVLSMNGFRMVFSPLVRDQDGVWRMDYEDMERRIRRNHIHVMIFCNPHNPTGRVWTADEIRQAMDVCERNSCMVISDEIWSDLMINGHVYTPAQSVSGWAHEHVAAFYAPSKTFNLAGLIGSYSVIYNPYLRDRIHSISRKEVYNEMNVLSQHALIGAYSEEGDSWLTQLLEVLSANINYAYEEVRTHLEGVTAFRTEGTYMMLLDCAEWLKKHGKTQQEMIQRGWDYGIGWQTGKLFESPTGIRLNLASPPSRIREAFRRMEKYVFGAEW